MVSLPLQLAPQQGRQRNFLEWLTRCHYFLLQTLQWVSITPERGKNSGFPTYLPGALGGPAFSLHASTHHTNKLCKWPMRLYMIWLASLAALCPSLPAVSWTYQSKIPSPLPHISLFYCPLWPWSPYENVIFGSTYTLVCFCIYGLSPLECKFREGRALIFPIHCSIYSIRNSAQHTEATY